MYYRQTIEAVLKTLGTSINGLTTLRAREKIAVFGYNELTDEKKVSRLKLFISQFKSFLIIILIAASVVSAILGEFAEATLIMIIVILSGVLGYVQEFRAEKSIEALKNMAAPNATVLRDGVETVIPSRELVPGDVMLLQTGDVIPADTRLIDAVNLKINEAALTGESLSVEKKVETIANEAAIGDRKNMAYTGTSVSYGRGKGVVTATGMQTELGKVAGMLEKIEREKTPLQESLDQLGRWIGLITMIVVVVVSVVGVLYGFEILDMFVWGVALAVAAIPEALPAVVTVSLALGVRRMTKRNSLVRKLPSVETLGATTVICSDKTGTLTQDEMTVVRVYANSRTLDVTGVGYEPVGEFYDSKVKIDPLKDEQLRKLFLISALCNDSELIRKDETWTIKGDPTEGGLMVVSAKSGMNLTELENAHKRIEEIPFSSERKRMTTIHETSAGMVAYSKGAPEVILMSCNRIFQDGTEVFLDNVGKKKILNIVHSMAENALRVMAFSYKPIISEDVPHSEIEGEMVFVGLAGMIDAPREEVKAAIETCDRAWIKTVMITGDHPLTARAVAKELGLLNDGGLILTGDELDTISDERFGEIVDDVSVYARVSPAHKMRVIDALKRKGHVVAMTGDGVNDAPALKAADIGVAMGITGTEVSKEASDMILTDDNFASIVAAVEEGRNIFKNIRNFVLYGLTCHLGEVLVVLIAMLAWQSLPIIAVQILWINLITDGLPPMALSVEPMDDRLMRERPRKKTESIINRRVITYSMAVGILIAIQALFVFRWEMDNSSLIKAQTMVFTMIVLSEMFNAFNWRSNRSSVFRLGIFSNRPLIYAVSVTVLLQLLVIYVPFLNGLFNTVPLDLSDWAIIIPLAATTLIFVELAKFVETKINSLKN